VPPISLSQFLKRSTTYESLPAPFSPALRRAAWWGIALCAASLCVYLFLPIEAIPLDADAFFILGEQFNAVISWIGNNISPLVISSLLGNIFGILLLICSRGLKQAKGEGHILAFIVVVIGLLCSLPLVASLTIVAITLVVQLLISVVVIGFLFAVLFGAFSH